MEVEIRPLARYLNPDQKRKPILNICEMNVDCLERICRFLSSKDLRNIAHTNDYLKAISAKILYKRLEAKGIREFYVDASADPSTDEELQFRPDSSMHVSHETVQICGSHMKCIQFHIRDQKTIEHLIRYCPNLEILTIQGNFNNSSKSDYFCKPLKKLRQLHISRGELSHTLTQFHYWCPNIENFEFHNIYNICNHNCLNYYFPRLQHFTVGSIFKFHGNELCSFLELNPQLQTLNVEWPRIDRNVFDFLCVKLKSLNTIKLRLTPDLIDVGPADKSKELINVYQAELQCTHHWYYVLRLVSFYFPLLKYLLIKVVDLVDEDDTILDVNSMVNSMVDISNLECLTLRGKIPNQLESMMKIAERMPNLKKLDVENDIDIDATPYYKCFECFPKLNELIVTGKVIKGGVPHFNVVFHKKFNKAVENRPNATAEINAEGFKGSKIKVSKGDIRQDGRIICRKLPSRI